MSFLLPPDWAHHGGPAIRPGWTVLLDHWRAPVAVGDWPHDWALWYESDGEVPTPAYGDPSTRREFAADDQEFLAGNLTVTASAWRVRERRSVLVDPADPFGERHVPEELVPAYYVAAAWRLPSGIYVGALGHARTPSEQETLLAVLRSIRLEHQDG